MARTRKLNLFASCCLLASVWALYLTITRQNAAESETPRAAPAESRTNLTGPSSADTRRHQDLNARVDRLADSLDEATTRLNAALTRLESTQDTRQQARFAEEEMALQMAGIAPPVETIQTEPDGRVTRSVTFGELIGSQGEKLATSVTFKEAYGRRLVFRGLDNQPLAFDAEELHPGVLAHLGIRLSDVLAADQREQRNRRLRAEAANRQRLARAREADSRNRALPADEPASVPLTQPSAQSTYITIQQPNASMPNGYYSNYPYYGYSSYSYPVYYSPHYRYPLWSCGFQNPILRGGALASPPTTRQLPQVQAAMASGFRFNNTFKFNR